MDGFNVSKIILGLQNPELYLKKLKGDEVGKIAGFSPELGASMGSGSKHNNLLQSLQTLTGATQLLQMNALVGMDRAIFVKNLLGLPANLWEILKNNQNLNKPLNTNTLGANSLNEFAFQNQKVLSSLFDDIAINVTEQASKSQADVAKILFSGMVNLSDISKLIIQNGKQAVAALILAMASASKQGVSNEQIQETLGLINSCISMAESGNPAQTLKSLMMLYLPWLPLNEGIGFDLEITAKSDDDDLNDSRLTVLIQTKNFGNLKGIFTLTTSNSIDVLIFCSEDFPKNILQKMLAEESSSHSMSSNIDIENTVTKPSTQEVEIQETKVNLSATNEMNPYLLLMAHAFIRNTILIDNNA